MAAEASKAEISSLKDKIDDAGLYLNEAELRADENLSEAQALQGQVDDMSYQLVRSAIKLGEAGGNLAKARQAKEEAFRVAQTDIVNTEKWCEA